VYHGIPTSQFTLTSGANTKQAVFTGSIWQKDSCVVNFLLPYSYTTTYASTIYNDKTYQDYANPSMIPITIEGQRCTKQSMLEYDYLTATGEIQDRAVNAVFDRRVAWVKLGFCDTFNVPMDIGLYGFNTLRIKVSSGVLIRTDTLNMTDPNGVYVASRDTADDVTYEFSPGELEKEVLPNGTKYWVYVSLIPSGVDTQFDVFLSSKIANWGGSLKAVNLEPNNFYHGTVRMQLVTHAEGGYKRFYDGIVSESVTAAGVGTKDSYWYEDLLVAMYGVVKDSYGDVSESEEQTMAGTKYDYTSPWDSVQSSGFSGHREDYEAIFAAIDYMTGWRTDYFASEASKGGFSGFHAPYDSKNAEQLPLTWLYHDVYETTELERGWFIKLLHQDYLETEDARRWFIELFHKDYFETEDARRWFIELFHLDYFKTEDARSWFIKLLHEDYFKTEDARSWFIKLLHLNYLGNKEGNSWLLELMKEGYVSPWAIYVANKQQAEKDGYDNGGNSSGSITGSKEGYEYGK
ncbi:MAG: hypothetical protein IKR18_09745, partial [Bacteroidaceae bacterium]|nr:hypothetical protein [Bacteroidaceae bacterium]